MMKSRESTPNDAYSRGLSKLEEKALAIPQSWTITNIARALQTHLPCIEGEAQVFAKYIWNFPRDLPDVSEDVRRHLEAVAAIMRVLPECALKALKTVLLNQHLMEILRRTGGRPEWGSTEITAVIREDPGFVRGLDCASRALAEVDLMEVVDRAVESAQPSRARGRGRPRALGQPALAAMALFVCREIIGRRRRNFSGEELQQTYRVLLRELFDLYGFRDPDTWAKKILKDGWWEKNTSLKLHFEVDNNK